MAYSWESLNNLKSALGDAGEGVISYLQGRKEDEARQQNFEALKQYHASLPPEQQVDPGLLGATFAQSGYRALPTIQALKPQTQLLPGAAPGQYQQATTPALGGNTTLKPVEGGMDMTNPENFPVGQFGLPAHIDSIDKAIMYRGMLQNLQDQYDRENQAATAQPPAPGAQPYIPKKLSPKLQNQADIADQMIQAHTKQKAIEGNQLLDRQKELAQYKVKEIDPIKQQAGIDAYARKLNLKTKADASQLDPVTLETEGRRWAATGELPKGMGMGGFGVKAAIIARGDQILHEEGIQDPEAMSAAYRAHADAYKKTLDLSAAIGAREKGAERNLNNAQKWSNQYSRSNLPQLNGFLNWYRQNLDNNTNVVGFNNAIYAGIRDWAKVTTGSTGQAELSVEATKAAEKMLNSMQTPDQVKTAIQVMRQDMQNFSGGIEDQLKLQRDALTVFPSRKANAVPHAGGNTPAPARESYWNPTTKKLETR